MSMTSIGILYIHLCKMLRKERFSPQHMATYLNQLISEPEEYLKYFWWEPYFQVISNEYPRMYGFLKCKFNLIQVEAYVDPMDPHQLPSTFPCNLCSHLHQAEQPTQVWDSIYPFKSWLPLFWRLSRHSPHVHTRYRRLRKIGAKMPPVSNISHTIAIGSDKKINCLTLKFNKNTMW